MRARVSVITMLTTHYHRSQQQELATALVLVGGDSQDRSRHSWIQQIAMVHPSAFVLNGPRLVVVAAPGLTQRTSAVYAI